MRVEQANTTYNNYRIPALTVTKSGTLLAAYECRKSVSDWAVIDIKIIKSEDGGNTWRQVLLLSGEDKHTMNNPVFITQGNVVHFLYCRNYRHLFYCKSVDGGETFSAAIEVPVCLPKGENYTVLAVGPGHGIVHNGALITPVWFANNPADSKAHHPSFIATLYSLDDGKTWAVGEQIGKDVFMNPSECAAAVTGAGEVLLSIRNENKVRMRGLAVSKTGYSDWQNVHLETALPDPICQGSMTSEQGVLYHVNCDSKEHREKLTLKISKDGFQTTEDVLIDDVGEYSDIAVYENVAYILYERDAVNDGLYFKKIKL